MIKNLDSNEVNDLDDRIGRAFNFFWIGFVIYITSVSFPNTSKESYYFTQGLQLLGIILFTPSFISLITWRFEYNYLKFIFNFFFFWSLIVIIRGIQFDIESIKKMLLSASGGIFLYFVPIVITFPRGIKYFKKIIDVILILSIFFIIYDLLFYRVLLWGITGPRLATSTIETFARQLSIPSGFILLTYIYHSGKRNIFALSIVILTFLLAAIRARRGLMFMSISLLVASYLVYYFTNKGKFLRIVLSIFLFIFLFIYGNEVYNSNRSGMFGLITGRMDEDTRTGVEDYFYSSMSNTDLLIGRGINGQYYCPGINETEGTVTIFRDTIETGYLQIILKGGIISFVLFLMMAIPAIILGFFYSNNLLSKSSAIWILLFLLYSYPTTINSFALDYILIWLSIGICFDPKIREKTNDEILAEFQ
jgi:hypothetical protein